MEEFLTEIVSETGPHAIWILFLAALVEYVFPPFPGDTVTLFGAYYAVAGALPIPLVFGAVTAGSVTGAAIDYFIGRRLRRKAETAERLPLLLRWVSPERVEGIERAWDRWGDWLILGNRFLPGVRSLFFVAAGMAEIPFRRVMILGAVSASLWNLVVLILGWVIGENLSKLEELFIAYSTVAWAAIAAAALVWLCWALWTRRRRAPQGDG